MARKKQRNNMSISEDELALILKVVVRGLTVNNKPTRARNKKTAFLRIRYAFMFYFAYYLGLRPMETRCILDDKHIDDVTHELYIPGENNKQNQEDNIPIPDFLWEKLQLYRKAKKEIFPESSALFPNRYGVFMSRGTHIRAFNRVVQISGLQQVSYVDAQGHKRLKFSLYTLRRSYAVLVYTRTRDVRKLAVMLRHYDYQYRTTLTYVHMFNSKQRRPIMNEIFKDDSFEVFDCKDEE